jgi:hypothetical protein
MTNFIYKYIIIIFILYIIYNLIPSNNIINTDIYLFISLGLIIFYFINKYIFNINEYFDQEYLLKNQINKLPTQSVTQSPTQSVTQSPTQSVAQSPTQSVTQSPIQSAQPVMQLPAQPVMQLPAQPGQPVMQLPASMQIPVQNDKSVEISMIYKLQNKLNDLEQLIRSNYNSTISETTNDDMKYNQLTSEQMIALGAGDKTVSKKWDNTYTLLNTDKWKPPARREKVCKQEKSCPVCPSITSGYPLNVMDYDKSRYIMGPDNISIDYIKNLNNPIKP